MVRMGVLAWLVVLGDWLWEGFLALELFFFDGVDGRNRTDLFFLRSRFLLLVDGRHCLKLCLIDLMIVDPVSSILNHSILSQLPKSVSQVILKIAHINHSIFVVYLPVSAFLVIPVLSTILYPSFMFFEVALTMPQSIRKLSFVVISVGPVIFPFAVWSIFLVGSDIGLPVVESFGAHSMLQ